MLVARCFAVLVAVVAAAIGGFIVLGKQMDLTKGMMPVLVVDPKIDFDTVPNLTGKTVVVTGANAGLGRAAAKNFVINGAETVMVCRSLKKCNDAKALILRELKEDVQSSKLGGKIAEAVEKNLIPMEADLGSFESIQRFGMVMAKRFQKVDSLVLNAGVMHSPFTLTADGIEQQIGVNHFGHFYMTKLLLPLLEKAQPSTVVSVSSNSHFKSYPEGIKLSFDDMNDESQYNRILAYGHSKLANVLFAQELSERLKKDGKKIYVNSMNPGAVNTDLLRHHTQLVKNIAAWLINTFPNQLFFESDYASLTEVYLAVGEDILSREVTGKYFVPMGQECGTSFHGKNMTLQKSLWKLSEQVLKDKGFA